MSDFDLRAFVAWLMCAIIILAAFAVGGLPAYFFGFAWGLIAIALIGAGAARLVGGGIEGGWTVIAIWFVLFVGFVIGLLVRWLT